jgi:hypothetical protein
MAKGPDHLVDSFATENTGGLLSGLLAEENIFDRSSLLRLGSWGALTVAAVIVALYASQSSMALRREQVAAVDLARQAQQIQSVARENQNETRRLASAVDTLNGDRDRLYTRVTVLEQGLDSVTGAITRQTAASVSTAAAPATAATATTAPAATVPAAAPEPETEAAPSPAAVSAPAPAVTPVATTPVKNVEKPPADKPSAEKAPARVAAATVKAPPPPAVIPAPLVATKSIMAPPDAAATKLIESENREKPEKLITSAPIPDVVVASAPPADDAETEAAETPPPKVEVQRTEFGVDLGGANSLGGLRALWRGLLKSRSNAALTGLRPIIVIREGRNGLGMQLRLVAGPFSDAAAAAKICAGLIENDRSCETAVFDGQRLIANPSESNAAVDKSVADKPAAEKPAAAKPFVYRRGYSRRGANGEPAKKPDPAASFSSLFSRR